MDYLYGYKVKYYNECENKSVVERGVTIAATFEEAVGSIINFYGEEECGEIKIWFVEEGFGKTIPESSIQSAWIKENK